MTGFLDDKILPVDIRPDAQFGAAFSTSIISLRGGGEYRNAQWAHPLRSFEVAYGTREQKKIEENIIAFAMTTRGALYGFRARDWSDHVARDATTATGDGTTWWFRLYKPYGDYQRRIQKPDATEALIVSVDNVAVPPSQVAVDYAQGVVVFKTAPLTGAEIAWTGRFHVPVRFTDDVVNVVMNYYRIGSVQQLGLTEIRLRDDIDTAALAALRATL